MSRILKLNDITDVEYLELRMRLTDEDYDNWFDSSEGRQIFVPFKPLNQIHNSTRYLTLRGITYAMVAEHNDTNIWVAYDSYRSINLRGSAFASYNETMNAILQGRQVTVPSGIFNYV